MKYADFSQGPCCLSCGKRPVGCICPLKPLGYSPPEWTKSHKSPATVYRDGLIKIQRRIEKFENSSLQNQQAQSLATLSSIQKIVEGLLK